MIKIKGKVKYRKNDFYILSIDSTGYGIIESIDELEIGDIIGFDNLGNFFNKSQNCSISVMIQSDLMGFQDAIETLERW